MERLTTRCSGYAVMAWEHEEKHTTQEWIDMLTDRLAAYEDSGLEPEDIAAVMDPEVAALARDLQRILSADQRIDLEAWIKADKAGRLVVLPCKVGDHVWADGREAIVVWFFGYKTERYLHAQFLDNAEYTDIPFYEIGKTVFLTREEAEAALEGGESDA